MTDRDVGAKRLAWIYALEQCESGGKTDFRILDTNNRYSYSILQFQKATFDTYGELYRLPHDDIYSKDQQEMIALYILNDGGWRNWLNCGKATTSKLGYSYPSDV